MILCMCVVVGVVAEEGMSQKSKTSDSGTAEHRRLVKNMETQLQVSAGLSM